MDDDEAILTLLRLVLQDEGYGVTASPELLDLASIRLLRPNLIVLDVLFAGREMGGWCLAAQLQQDRALCRVPIVVCTAAMQVSPPRDAPLDGRGLRVVPKPFDLEPLLAVIEGCLHRESPTAQTTRTTRPESPRRRACRDGTTTSSEG